jgi:hypothetical protein
METLKNRYMFNGEDVTLDVLLKIEHTVEKISDAESRPFDAVYGDFLNSKTYRAIQDTQSLMWYENAEFIANEYKQ